MNKKEVLEIAHRLIAQCKIIRKARLELPMINPRFVIGEAVDNIGRCISELEDLCGKPTAKETEKTEDKPTDPTDHSFWDVMKLREDNDLLRQANIRLTTERDLYDRLYHELLGRCSTEAPNAQQTPKRYVVAVKFKCKECGERYEVYFSPLQRRLDLLERTLSSRKCEKCGGQLEEIERYVDEKG